MFNTANSSVSRRARNGGRHRAFRLRTVLSSALVVAAVAAISVVGKQPASASALPPSWKLTFDSNFAGTAVKGSVNPKAWTTCFPWAAPGKGCSDLGNAGADVEWYLPSQVKVKNGVLNLTAKREVTQGYNAKGKPKKYDCRSGMVTTFSGFKFEYGFVQVTARLPYGTGLWPAFWLAAANEKWPPEVDILEHWGDQTVSKLYLHPVSGSRQGAVYSTPTADSGWHTWRLYWTKTRLTWYYDGRETYTTTTGVPHQAMYFIADLADTTNAAADTNIKGGACNGTLLIQSVKVWQP
jgi:beta-glucanase (GH16 family)